MRIRENAMKHSRKHSRATEMEALSDCDPPRGSPGVSRGDVIDFGGPAAGAAWQAEAAAGSCSGGREGGGSRYVESAGRVTTATQIRGGNWAIRFGHGRGCCPAALLPPPRVRTALFVANAPIRPGQGSGHFSPRALRKSDSFLTRRALNFQRTGRAAGQNKCS